MARHVLFAHARYSTASEDAAGLFSKLAAAGTTKPGVPKKRSTSANLADAEKKVQDEADPVAEAAEAAEVAEGGEAAEAAEAAEVAEAGEGTAEGTTEGGE